MDNSPTFLRIPLYIRIQIYRLCNIVRPCPIDLNFEGVRRRWIAIEHATQNSERLCVCQYQRLRGPARRSPQPNYSSGVRCFCPSLPHQLLYASHAIYDEIMPLLYGENEFRVLPSKEDSPGHQLKVLWTLNSDAWKRIKSLHIGFTVTIPLQCSPDHPGIETIDVKSIAGSKLLREWSALVEHLACRIPSSSMKLDFNCMVKDIDSGVQFVEPLKRLPRIIGAAVCLSPNPGHTTMKDMAKTAVLELTRKAQHHSTPQKQSFSWNLLPGEIRLQILGYTDLVVRQSPTHSQLSQSDSFEIKAGSLIPRAKKCCFHCTSTLSVCYCPFKRAASSNTCICPAVPVALFISSRLVHSDATSVFFSQNSFTFTGNFGATRRWIFNLPSIYTQHLRTIELGISYEQLYWHIRDPDTQVARDWIALITSIASLLPLPKLCLIINARRMRETLLDLYDHGDDDHAWLHTAYMQLFDPLYKQLRGRGLRNFYVLLPWWLQYETAAERAVMGPGYDSESEGKSDFSRRHFVQQ